MGATESYPEHHGVMIYVLSRWIMSWQLWAIILVSPFIIIQSVKLYILYVKPKFHYLRDLPGEAKTSHWIIGSNGKIYTRDPGQQALEWQRQYGDVYTYWDYLGGVTLGLADLKGIAHIFNKSQTIYYKPAGVRYFIALIAGPGLVFAEGDQHKAQRKMIQPSFSVPHLKELFPVFVRCGDKVVAQWKAAIKSGKNTDLSQVLTPTGEVKELEEILKTVEKESGNGENPGVLVDIYSWTKRAALDVIGLAGFGHDFGSLDGLQTRLGKALEQGSASRASRRPDEAGLSVNGYLMTFPWLLRVPFKQLRVTKASLKISTEECWKIFHEKKAAIVQAGREKDYNGAPKKQRDLIDLLIKANLTEKENQRVTDEEVMSQMTTFVSAGDTSSIGLAYALRRLALNARIQDKLRQEAKQAFEDAKSRGEEMLDFESIEGLPYLSAVIREVLRLDAPVAQVARMATENDRIPLSKPVKLRDGREIDYVDVKKGQVIHVPIIAIHKSKEMWGEDAEEFRPERWLEGIPESVTADAKGASAFSSLLTFSGGSRACIGYRFAVLEMKTLLVSLIYEFKFEDVGIPIEAVDVVVCRPKVKGAINAYPMLPLRVSLAD